MAHSIGRAIKGLFGGGSKPEPPTPKPLPNSPKPEYSAAKAAETIRRRKANQTQTVFGSPLGLAGEANVARKRLLGQ